MMTWMRFLIVAWLAIGSAFGFSFSNEAATDTILVTHLPREARQTLELIKTGGPFPYGRDGIVFGNFERRLPQHPRGFYREYTVKSPWRRDRGPRRIIVGRDDSYYYTDDHYQSFRRIVE
ncbi:ribonuclease domain-containing protein [Dechloromonas sp. HYN0024]|jgi:ribonuclease T1|uniref:ribonuclease domain-containing protein n=1 Tax=Dechloromonas sp. HYN0024 TaxID=2231055 RepID=UPI000E43DF47|nr:ribonuclease domain-containing protein [Dechloromonas sp. HYN0024]AXS79049.1 ribonuclease [Dechloromonas sp. HYN0024]